MDYNTTRQKMKLPEYGRIVHEMVAHAITVEDRETRNRMARTIVNVMAQLQPHNRDQADYKHKLWDHLFIISDFKLDVDSPYEKPDIEKQQAKPQKIAYSNNHIAFRYYGRNLQNIIKALSEQEDSPERQQQVHNVANMMKKLYLTWNRDSVTDEVIADHLFQISGGKLQLSPETKLEQNVYINQQRQQQGSFQRNKKRSSGKYYFKNRKSNH